MAYRSNVGNAVGAMYEGVDTGLVAAAENLENKVQHRLLHQAAGGRPGYTSGNFSHGIRGVAGRVMRTEPYSRGGARMISIGTSTVAGFPYELAWELGHVNLFTRTFVRVEVWRPTLEENRQLVTDILARNIRDRTGGAASIRPVLTLSRGRG